MPPHAAGPAAGGEGGASPAATPPTLAGPYAGGATEAIAPADTVVRSTVSGERWADAADLLSTPDEVVSVHFAGAVVVAAEADVLSLIHI